MRFRSPTAITSPILDASRAPVRSLNSQNERTTHVELAVHILFVNHTRFGAAVIFIAACVSPRSFAFSVDGRAKDDVIWWQQPLIVCINWLYILFDEHAHGTLMRPIQKMKRFRDPFSGRGKEIGRRRIYPSTNEWLNNFDKFHH